jgi:uncharacterized protein (TIRG00374 family)
MDPNTPHRSRQRLLIVLVVILVLVGGFTVLADWEEVRIVIEQAEWVALLYALFFTVIAYVCVSINFAVICRLLDIRMNVVELSEIGFVSTVLNHVVQSGGVAGYSVRYTFISRSGATNKDILAASIFQFYLTSIVMLSMLPVGLIYLMLNAQMKPGITVLIALATLLLMILFTLATLFVFRSSTRSRLLSITGKLVSFITRRDVGDTLVNFDETMTRGVAALHKHPRGLIQIITLVTIDWIASMIVLWFCFDALGPSVPAGALVAGFVIGIMVGVASMLPAGIGVQDFSMAGVFALLGYSFEQAVLASILWRGVFYLLPYIASLGFYWHLMRRMRRDLAISSQEVDHAHLDA